MPGLASQITTSMAAGISEAEAGSGSTGYELASGSLIAVCCRRQLWIRRIMPASRRSVCTQYVLYRREQPVPGTRYGTIV
jgi:hypothetical protein